MPADRASRTAVLVCQGRAVAHGRLAVGRFDDPTALRLLRETERTPVMRARAVPTSKGLAARLDVELLGRQAEAMALRTVAVDDAVRAAGNPQLVIVGAGLDGRAWRMSELAQVDVFEVDHPASQHEKRSRAVALGPPVGRHHFVAADLDEVDLGAVLFAAGHDATGPTTWILEGVIPYLSEQAAATTLTAIAGRSVPGSTVVLTYQLESPRGRLGRLLARALLVLMGRGDPMANESRRSSWSRETVQALVAEAGFLLREDIGLVALAGELSVPDRHVHASRVAVSVSPGG